MLTVGVQLQVLERVVLTAKFCYSTGFIHTTVSVVSGNNCLAGISLIFSNLTQHTDLNMAFYSQVCNVKYLRGGTASADALLLSFLFLVNLRLREDTGLCLLQMPTTLQ